MKLLFITWDGPQVSYLEGLFLPIFRGLQAHGVHTDVLQFRWGSSEQQAAIGRRCEEFGCGYRAVPVIRWAGAAGAFATAILGGRQVKRAARDFGSDVLMPRAITPALAVLAAGAAGGRPVAFDADGLPADEKVEFAGMSPQAPAYLALKRIEATMTRRADVVLVRSAAAAEILAAEAGVDSRRFHVVVNGRDDSLFAPGSPEQRAAAREALGVAGDAPLLVYSGSVGPQYRFDLLAETVVAVRRRLPSARLLILTGQPDEAAAELRRHAPGLIDIALLRTVAPDRVPGLIAAADVGLGFRAVTRSARALAPIKIGEYLLCGVPVVGTAAIGDTAAAVEAGVFRDESAGPDGLAHWITEVVLPGRDRLRQVARQVGTDHFSLTRSIASYERALREINHLA